LTSAAEAAIRVGAWGLLRTTHAVAAMCGHVGEPLPVPTSEVAAYIPFAERVIAAWRARDVLRAGDSQTASAIFATTAPSPSALCAWTEVSLAVHGRERTAAAVAETAEPATAAAHVERLLVDASLTPDGGRRDGLLRAAVSEARARGLDGLLRGYPGAIGELLVAADGDERVEALIGCRTPDGIRTAGSSFSAREIEILRLLDGPLTINEIGPRVYLSSHTVKWYVSRIYRKLDVHDRSDALERARWLGLLSDPQLGRLTD